MLAGRKPVLLVRDTWKLAHLTVRCSWGIF
jgi:hypothetical protein